MRSNNSWMHNLRMLVSSPEQCTLQVHPLDSARLDLKTGGLACVSSRVGLVEATVEVTDQIAPGVVSLPHGWGHDAPGARLFLAAAYPCVNINVLADDAGLHPLSGNAVLNVVRVEVLASEVGAS